MAFQLLIFHLAGAICLPGGPLQANFSIKLAKFDEKGLQSKPCLGVTFWMHMHTGL
jgi:hypothetical protein